jgi:hypothetical protein
MPSFIINVDLDRTIYRHNPIADAIAQSIIAVIAISMFILVMIQTICVTNVDYVLDMVADNIVGNLGGNNSDLTTFTNFTGLCGPDSACLIGADLLDGLWFMGPSSSPRNQANDLSGPSAFLNPSLLANISHVPHIPNPYNSSLYIPLTATPENIARLYGILLALPQEIQAYCAVGVVYITLPIATIVISRQKKPFGCSQQKYHSYAAPASRFVKGMHQAVHYCKATVLGLYGLVLFAFRQENLLPHSQYQDPLWSAAGFYGKQWLKALGQTLIFQPTTAAEDIHPNSHEAYQIQLAILAWGTAWTAFLAWAPPVMFASMIFLGIKANFCCEKRDEIPLVTTIKVSRLFQTTRGPHALINVLDEDSSSGCGVNDTTELDAEIPTTPSHGGTSPQGTKTPNGTP